MNKTMHMIETIYKWTSEGDVVVWILSDKDPLASWIEPWTDSPDIALEIHQAMRTQQEPQ